MAVNNKKWKTAIDLTGMNYGKLEVIKRNGTSKNGHAVWECKCQCGRLVKVSSSDLRTGNTSSCGCERKKNFNHVIHGRSRERLYGIYNAMKTRCRNNPYYVHVSVCEEWLDNYESFRSWALSNGYSDELTIDRIDNSGNYEPSNCRWTTMKEQRKNQRKRGTALCQ
jgi:hypothetical protein